MRISDWSSDVCSSDLTLCNLVTMKASVDEVASAFRARRPPATNAVPGEVWKGGTGFVVREEDGERTMAAMHWGFPRHSINKRTGSPNKPSPVNNPPTHNLMTPFGLCLTWGPEVRRCGTDVS